MSDLLVLATDLRERSDESLAGLLRRRNLSGHPKDFFDLAQSLFSQKSISSALTKLAAAEALALQWLVAPRPDLQEPTDKDLLALASLGLIHNSAGAWRCYESVALLAEPLLRNKAISLNANLAEGQFRQAPDSSATLGLAAISIFETQQAITELVLDVEQHPIRQIGKTGIGVGDIKRLAAHLRRNNSSVRGYYTFALQLHLIELISERWWLSSQAQEFLSAGMLERWSMLARQWVSSLGEVGSKQLLALLQSRAGNLEETLKAVFPLADETVDDQLSLLLEQAQGIGFSVSGEPTQLLLQCLEGQISVAEDQLQPHLPQLQHSLIVQADLSLIAPGPLDTATELTLRKFANIEQVSVASTYRLSALSLSHGLECGLTVEQIRTVLTDLSSKQLPQPVEYLLREAETRFGRLTISVGSGAERSILRSSDGILLTEILNDSRLRPFAFFALSAGSLASRFEPEVVYFGLRDFGYLPVRVDAEGQVLSPQRAASWSPGLAPTKADPLLALISALREADARVGAQPDDQDLTRQIQLAMKNKAQLSVTLTDRAGTEVEFRIVPTALANGRLRGLDKRADIERTLPLDRIVRVAIG